jgi:hypothetical protein
MESKSRTCRKKSARNVNDPLRGEKSGRAIGGMFGIAAMPAAGAGSQEKHDNTAFHIAMPS